MSIPVMDLLRTKMRTPGAAPARTVAVIGWPIRRGYPAVPWSRAPHRAAPQASCGGASVGPATGGAPEASGGGASVGPATDGARAQPPTRPPSHPPHVVGAAALLADVLG